MLNELIVVTVTPFSGTTTPDKNGKPSVMLQCEAGRMPNRNVLAGTLAERQGFEVGKTYLAQVRERGYDKIFGTDFNFIKVMELKSGEDIVKTVKEIGPPQIIIIDRPERFFEEYERKGDAVESLQTRRIQEGLYTPAIPRTSSDHVTARKVVDGTTITGSRKEQRIGEDDEDVRERDRGDDNREDLRNPK